MTNDFKEEKIQRDDLNVKPIAVYALVLNGTYVWTLNWKNKESAERAGVIKQSSGAMIVGNENFSRVAVMLPETKSYAEVKQSSVKPVEPLGGGGVPSMAQSAGFITFPGGVVGRFESPQCTLETKSKEAGLLLIGEPTMVHQNSIDIIASLPRSGNHRNNNSLNEKRVNWYVYNSAVELLEISSKRENDGVFLRRTHIGQICEQNQEFEFLKKLIKNKHKI